MGGLRPSEWRKGLQELADEFGRSVEVRSNGHLTLLDKDSSVPKIFCSSSSSDRRALLNIRSQLRRARETDEERKT